MFTLFFNFFLVFICIYPTSKSRKKEQEKKYKVSKKGRIYLHHILYASVFTSQSRSTVVNRRGATSTAPSLNTGASRTAPHLSGLASVGGYPSPPAEFILQNHMLYSAHPTEPVVTFVLFMATSQSSSTSGVSHGG